MSASSGLKRSSGETLYTNGSTMSFPQQGKSEYPFQKNTVHSSASHSRF